MSDLTEFLLARVAEDEADASAASEHRLWVISQADDRIVNDAGHMQRFMPSRILAECEAKRRIVSLCSPIIPSDCGVPEVLNALALPYADHPDYREEWRP